MASRHFPAMGGTLVSGVTWTSIISRRCLHPCAGRSLLPASKIPHGGRGVAHRAITSCLRMGWTCNAGTWQHLPHFLSYQGTQDSKALEGL